MNKYWFDYRHHFVSFSRTNRSISKLSGVYSAFAPNRIIYDTNCCEFIINF